MVGLPRHHLRTRHGVRSAFPFRPRRAAEPVHASTTSNPYGSTPSLMHVMLPESLPSTRGPGIATPASLLPSVIAPHLRSLSSTGITRRHQSYGPLRHPDRPGLPLAGVRFARATPPTGLPVLRPSPLLHACRRHYPGGAGRCSRRSLPGRWQPSPDSRRVGFRMSCFEACSAFHCALRPACSLNRPRRPFSSECFRRSRYLPHPLRLLPAGATVAGRDSHPLRNGAFARRTTKFSITH